MAIALGGALAGDPARAAGTYYVDRANPACSDGGPGTEARPYCSISAAVNSRGGPGTIILVKPGIYREQVDIRTGGAAGSPYVLRALGPGVIVDGADDFSSPASWSLVSGTVWRAPGVTWDPPQVMVDRVRLARSTAAPDALPANTFRWISGEGLYVNLGGGHPGRRETMVSRRNHGFNMATRSWITIEGFTVLHAGSRGIFMQSGCTNITIARNVVGLSSGSGIQATGGTGILIEGNASMDNGPHGIALTSGATGCVVRDNECSFSRDPDIRRADGIYLYGAPGNTIERNRLHHNQDSGLHFGSGSHNCVAFNNVSWSNGDHGYDHLGATGTLHMHDVAYRNTKDGFSIEGGATGTQLYNCIAVDNGLTTNEHNLWVEPGSETGFVSDYNIFWNSDGQEPVNYLRREYLRVADYSAASGQDAYSLQTDPRFVDPAAGDFRLRRGSPAIDSGTSALPLWPARDALERPRADVPAVVDAGAGTVPYADRGAFEYQPVAPEARLEVAARIGSVPLEVTADASASFDADGTVLSYLFDFGDGTRVGPQAFPVATHRYGAGLRTVTVTITDDDGMVASRARPPEFVPPTVFPNPIGEQGWIRLAITEPGPLTVRIFDLAGRSLRTVAREPNALVGPHQFALDRRTDDGRRMGAGVYFYRVEAPERTVSGRFVVLP